MRDTVHVLIEEEGNEEEMLQSIKEMVKEVQEYVPGYRLNAEPQIAGKQVSVFIEVEGAGDYFPSYSGNLDIMTAAALQAGATYIDGSLRALGAGSGNTQTEVMAAVLEKMGYNTGIDL